MGREPRFLGDLDAAADQHFTEHFVESQELTRLLTNKSDIIYGSKGVGKTALRRALTEIKSDYFFATITIDLDDLSFAEVHSALEKLQNTAQREITRLARTTWQNCLAMYCLDAVKDKLDTGLAERITAFLFEEGFANAGSNARLLTQIERIMLRVVGAATEMEKPAPLGLTSNQQRAMSTFPISNEMKALLEESANAVRSAGTAVLVCIDGFDSIVDHTPASRQTVFAGLIDAIHRLSRDGMVTSAFCFKAFLPQELAFDAARMVWDRDKFIYNTRYLRWREADFQTFVRKRLTPFSRTRSAQFLDVWHEHMPDRVQNDKHRADERSFQYILRHTLYRPRQVLAQLQNILSAWDEVSPALRVDPSFIPSVVASTNLVLAESVVAQLSVRYPMLDTFMKSWSGGPNTMRAGELRGRIGRLLDCGDAPAVDRCFDALFNDGVFGIAPRARAAKGSQSTKFQFGFVGDRFQSIYSSVTDGDLLALSPMFHEFCGCTPSEYGVVVPSDQL